MESDNGDPVKNNTSKQLNLELYKKLYLIRKSEQRICELYPEDEMKTPVHLSLGQEAIVAGTLQALKPNDQIFGTYRSHGLYLAKTGETDKFFAELYGKKTGLARGKAGSMHLSAPEKGFLGSSAIVAGHISVAIGAAFANKREKNNKIVAVYFGDGATEEGVFWESLNAACLMKLPVIFICEDNELAVFTHKHVRRGYKSLSDIVARFNCHVTSASTTDAEKICDITKRALALIRKTGQPHFLHLRYYRYVEHVGVFEDFDAGYRSRDEFQQWHKIDPVHLQREKLLKIGYSSKKIMAIETKIDQQIEKSISRAKIAPFPAQEELESELYI